MIQTMSQCGETAIVTSQAEVIALHQSANAWKPLHKLKETVEFNPEVSRQERLKRNVQSVLNKLTFQKFKVLLEALKLNISSEKEINPVGCLIYENAIYEPKFSCIYAALCKHLEMTELSKSSLKDEQIRCSKVVSVVLHMCKKEFEENFKADEVQNANSGPITEKCKCEEEKWKAKLRRIGNIKFLGELFKLHLISKPILQEYIKRLIEIENEESLECLFILMKTCGKELEIESISEQQIIQGYFLQIQGIVDKHVTSPRIYYLLQDILDLRNNNWIPRKIEVTPKTIEEIHKELDIESQNQSMAKQNKHRKKNKKATAQGNDLVSHATKNEVACHSKDTASRLHTPGSLGRKNKAKGKAIPINFSSPIELHQCENAWKPRYKLIKESEVSAEAWEQEKLKRNVQSILNKLTFQKFQVLLSQLKLYILTGTDVIVVVNLIYENAICDPRFGILYAALCVQLQQIKRSLPISNHQIGFSKVMSEKCQIEFNNHFGKHKQSCCEDVLCSDKRQQVLVEREIRKCRARRIGNIRFIGELFNVKILPSCGPEECIKLLLSLNNEESLECLYWLLRTLRKKLESMVPSDKQLIENCFSTLQNIVIKQTTSKRIRFLLQDIIDLKNNNWVPRRKEIIPRTIDEIHEQWRIQTGGTGERAPPRREHFSRSGYVHEEASLEDSNIP